MCELLKLFSVDPKKLSYLQNLTIKQIREISEKRIL